MLYGGNNATNTAINNAAGRKCQKENIKMLKKKQQKVRRLPQWRTWKMRHSANSQRNYCQQSQDWIASNCSNALITSRTAYVRAKQASINRLGFTSIRWSIGAQDRDRCNKVKIHGGWQSSSFALSANLWSLNENALARNECARDPYTSDIRTHSALGGCCAERDRDHCQQASVRCAIESE